MTLAATKELKFAQEGRARPIREKAGALQTHLRTGPVTQMLAT